MPAPAEKYPGRTGFLPRLTPNFYKGDAVILWTLPIKNRNKSWLTPSFHTTFRELLLHTSVRQSLLCPLYVLMPDHMHLVWMGLRPNSDQKVAMAFLRTHLEPFLTPHKFQHQAHDRVLREDDRRRTTFAKICHYVLMNPIRAELTKNPSDWPYLGSLIPGYPNIHPIDHDFWPTFWKLYSKARETNRI